MRPLALKPPPPPPPPTPETCVQVSFGDGQSFRCSADQLGADRRRAALKPPLARVIETVCLWQGDCSEGSPAHSIHHTALKGAAGLLRADWHPCSGPTDLMGCVCAQPPAHHAYQLVNSREGVVRVVQGVDQLVHPIVGLTVSIETDTHCSTTSKTPNKGDVTSREYTYLPLCTCVCACAPGGQERMLVPSSIALWIIPLGQSLSLSLEFTERTMLAASELSLVPIPSAGIADV